MLHFIERFLKHLAPAITQTCAQLTEWQMRSADYQSPGVYHWRDNSVHTLRVGEHWGLPGTTVFLQRKVQVPPECRGRKVGLALITGGEALVRLDGRPYHGLDANRWFVPLLESATGGEQFDVQIEAFNPVPSAPDVMNNPGSVAAQVNRTLERADLVLYNKPAADLWYTLRVYADTIQALPESSPSRKRLHKAMTLVVEQLETADPAHLDPTTVQAAISGLHNEAAQLAETQPGALCMIGQSHIDVAWHWPVKETVRKVSRTFATAVTLMDEYPHYLYSQSQAKLYAFTKQHYPDLYARIKEKVQQGRWEIVGGMWVEPDLNIPSGESLVRQVLFGQRFWQQEFGSRSHVEWLPDTFGYCAALPQILRKAGIDSFMTVKMYWNDTNKFPYDLFWWEGIDGTRVLAYINHGLNEPAHARDIKNHWEAFKQKVSYPVGMYLYGHGDGGGGVTREMLEYIARERQLPGLPQVATGKAHDYFAGVLAAQPDLPLWRGDLYLELHRGTYTSQAAVKKHNRRGEFLLHDTELWSTLASVVGQPYPKKELRQAWEILLLNQFHDILPGSSDPQIYRDAAETYAEMRNVASQAQAGALDKLADATDTQGPGRPVIVRNSLSWQRTDVVKLRSSDATLPVTVVDANGNSVPSQWVETPAGQRELWFLADNIPSLGHHVFWLADNAATPVPASSAKPLHLPATWETAKLSVTFNAQGLIERIFDKEQSREVVPAGSLANQLQLFVDRPPHWDAWDVDPRYPKMPFEQGTLVSASVVSQGPVADILRFCWNIGNSQVQQDIVLYRHTSRVDFSTHVSWHEEHRMLKVAFPVEILSAQATFEIPFGSIQRATHTNTSWEQAQHEVCGHKWADLSEGGYGVSLLNDCKYGYDVKGNTLRLTLLRAPKYPDPGADIGEHYFTYALFPHTHDWRIGGTVQEGFALNVPLSAQLSDHHTGILPSVYSVAELDTNHVVLDTVKLSEDGNDVVLRFYEAYGARGPVRVRLHLPVGDIVETNLLEEPERAIALSEGEFTFDIKPYEIRTFKCASPGVKYAFRA